MYTVPTVQGSPEDTVYSVCTGRLIQVTAIGHSNSVRGCLRRGKGERRLRLCPLVRRGNSREDDAAHEQCDMPAMISGAANKWYKR